MIGLKIYHLMVIVLHCTLFRLAIAEHEPILESFEKLADDVSKFQQIRANSQLARLIPPEESDDLHSEIFHFNASDINKIIDETAEELTLWTDEILANLIDCRRDLLHVFLNFRHPLKQPWVLQMLDSDGKIPSGLEQGNFIWPGSYSECKSVFAPANNLTKGFHGRHCMQTWGLMIMNKTIPLSVGVCVPDSCHEKDLMDLANLVLILKRSLPFLKNMTSQKFAIKLVSVSCQPMKPMKFDNPAIGMLSLLSVFCLLMVCGTSITIYEVYLKRFIPIHTTPVYNEVANVNGYPTTIVSPSSRMSTDDGIANGNPTYVSKGDASFAINTITEDMNSAKFNPQYDVNLQDEVEHLETRDTVKLIRVSSDRWTLTTWIKNILQCFCVITNGKKMLSTDKSKNEMLCIHGIRFLSMSWVILGHTFAFCALGRLANIRELVTLIDNWEFQAILQGTYSVDSFFLMSGFLLVHIFLKETDKLEAKGEHMPWGKFYLHRYWRLTPVYAIVLFYDVALQKYVAEGPFWNAAGQEQECKNGGWSWNLLYFNNFDDTAQCFGWSWYLANDMQFFAISPLFLYPLKKWPIIGISIVACLMCASWATAIVTTYKYNLVPGYVTILNDGMKPDYQKRVADYFAKMYIKPYNRIAPYLIGVLLGYILWRMSKDKRTISLRTNIIGWLVAAFLGLSMTYGFYHSNPGMIVTSLYNAFSRSLFSLALAWVIFACVTDNGGVVNTILSFKLFIPLGRLTYCAYLVHPIIIIGYYSSMQTPLTFSNITLTILFLGFLLLSYGVAMITSLAFESPLMALERIKQRKNN